MTLSPALSSAAGTWMVHRQPLGDAVSQQTPNTFQQAAECWESHPSANSVMASSWRPHPMTLSPALPSAAGTWMVHRQPLGDAVSLEQSLDKNMPQRCSAQDTYDIEDIRCKMQGLLVNSLADGSLEHFLNMGMSQAKAAVDGCENMPDQEKE